MSENTINAPKTVTPYYAAQIVKALLAEEGFDDSKLTPQRLYSLVKSGQLTNVGGEGGKDGKILVDLEELGTWFKRYVESLKNGTAMTTTAADEAKDLLRAMITEPATVSDEAETE